MAQLVMPLTYDPIMWSRDRVRMHDRQFFNLLSTYFLKNNVS